MAVILSLGGLTREEETVESARRDDCGLARWEGRGGGVVHFDAAQKDSCKFGAEEREIKISPVIESEPIWSPCGYRWQGCPRRRFGVPLCLHGRERETSEAAMWW